MMGLGRIRFQGLELRLYALCFRVSQRWKEIGLDRGVRDSGWRGWLGGVLLGGGQGSQRGPGSYASPQPSP